MLLLTLEKEWNYGVLNKIKGKGSLSFSDENKQSINWKLIKEKIREGERVIAFIILSPCSANIVTHVYDQHH